MRYQRVAGLLSVWISVLFLTGSLVVAEENAPTGKAAEVNGVVITQEDVNRQMFALEQQILSTQGKAIRPDMVPGVRNQILNDLIGKELLYQESQEQKMAVEEKTVNEKVESLKKQFPSEKVFQDEMRQMSLTEGTLRSHIKKDLAVQQLVEKDILVKVHVSDEDAKAFYDGHPDLFKEPEKVRASHILLKVEANAEPAKKEETRKKMEGIKKRLENGEDFAALAKELSQDPSAEKGGDLGFFERGKMVKAFEDAAFSLKPGEVSGIVESPFGYHLIKVFDRQAERTVPYSESKERIKKYLWRVKFMEQKNVYVEALKKKGKVEIF
jgi:peptidyl-prolyl cis-trans isomerase C